MNRYFLGLSDKRIKEVARILESEGKAVYDFETNLEKIERGDIVIVSPAYKWKEEIISKLREGVLVFGSKVRDDHNKFLEKVRYVDLMSIEDFVIDNAKLTAENFLVDLILNTDSSMYEQKILILGNGRVAKALWYLFLKLGISFDVMMRREDEYNLSKLIANNSYKFDEYESRIGQYDVVINTIPTCLFKDASRFKENCVVFELASVNCLKDAKGVKYVLCPALPAKYSPKSAGRLIMNVVKDTLKGEK